MSQMTGFSPFLHFGWRDLRCPCKTALQRSERNSPYYLTDDIATAVAKLEKAGAQIALPPMELPGLGTFAIYISGDVQMGLWQV